MPQSSTNLQTDIFCWYFTHSPIKLPRAIVRRHLTESWKIFTGYATITDGINPSIYFKREIFFFGAQFSSVKLLAIVFFLPTNVATELGITDERKVDGRFPSGMSSVKKLPTNSESQTDRIVPSVKLWKLVVYKLLIS